MKKIVCILLVAGTMLGFLVAGCTPKPAPLTEAATPTREVLTSTPPPRPGWEGQWDNWVANARQEKRLVIYTDAGTSAREAWSQAFTPKYGIALEFVVASGGELVTKLASERGAGLYLADIYSGGATWDLDLKNKGYLDPIRPVLILPEVVDPKGWLGGQGPLFADKEKKYNVFLSAFPKWPATINTELVKPGEIKSYLDLLNPKWKGKIVMDDPTKPGTAFADFSAIGEAIMGWDFVRKLAKQEPMINREMRVPVEWLARGKYAIGISMKMDVLADLIHAGAPLKTIGLEEGPYLTCGSGALSLLNKAPNPNSANIFINWLLSAEAQSLYNRAVLRQSPRVDVSTEYLDPVDTIDPKKVYFIRDTEEFLSRGPELTSALKEIFDPLLAR